jgi:hypothetical protein
MRVPATSFFRYSSLFFMALVGNNAASQQIAVVPFELIENFPVVQVDFGDQRVPLLFDLGSDDVALSTEALQSLPVQTLAETYTLFDVYGNKIEGRKFLAPRIGIGSLEFRDVVGTEYAEAPFASGHFGLQFAKAFRIVLDYKEQKMTFIPLDEPDPAQHGCYGTEVSFEQGWPATKASTDWGELFLVWDTGAPMNVIRESVVNARRIATDNFTARSDEFTLGPAEFGPIQFRSVDFEQPPGVDGFVGYDFFAKHVVCIDFGDERFLIRPNM